MFSAKTLFAWWDKFFYGEDSPVSLALFRIFFGLINILNAVSLIPDAKVWYGVNIGSTMPLWLSENLYLGFRVNLFNWLAPSDIAVYFILYGYLLASILVTLGLKTRLASILLCLNLT